MNEEGLAFADRDFGGELRHGGANTKPLRCNISRITQNKKGDALRPLFCFSLIRY